MPLQGWSEFSVELEWFCILTCISLIMIHNPPIFLPLRQDCQGPSSVSNAALFYRVALDDGLSFGDARVWWFHGGFPMKSGFSIHWIHSFASPQSRPDLKIVCSTRAWTPPTNGPHLSGRIDGPMFSPRTDLGASATNAANAASAVRHSAAMFHWGVLGSFINVFWCLVPSSSHIHQSPSYWWLLFVIVIVSTCSVFQDVSRCSKMFQLPKWRFQGISVALDGSLGSSIPRPWLSSSSTFSAS